MTDNVFKFLWKYLSKLKFLFFAVLLSVIFGEACVRIALYYASLIVEALSSSQPHDEVLRAALGFAWINGGLLVFKRGPA